ncbi:DUF1003 domain-containing protein [Candidatus Gottesmanbacteria bacterium]|nr:DUF1003 domain-containing protein [Candidatus Gottesmanbacteria bacterium]
MPDQTPYSSHTNGNGNGSARRTTRQLIQSFEAKALRKRPLSVKIADWLTNYFGTMGFFGTNGILFVVWIAINNGWVPGIRPIDPFPYILLTMIVSLEAIFLSIVVLMSQNRQGYVSSLRDELGLQVNLIAERELTKSLQLLADLHKHHGVKRASDPELEAMLKDTDISYIERKLEEQLQPPPAKTLPQIVAQPIVKLGQTVTNALQTTKNGESTVHVGVGKPK